MTDIPMVAWFVCRASGICDDVALPLTPEGASKTEEEIASLGRMRAARRFKRYHSLHPCTKVVVEFQAVMPRNLYEEERK